MFVALWIVIGFNEKMTPYSLSVFCVTCCNLHTYKNGHWTEWYFPRQVPTRSMDACQLDENQVHVQECLYYLTTYGNHHMLINFYREHGFLQRAAQYILDQVCVISFKNTIIGWCASFLVLFSIIRPPEPRSGEVGVRYSVSPSWPKLAPRIFWYLAKAPELLCYLDLDMWYRNPITNPVWTGERTVVNPVWTGERPVVNPVWTGERIVINPAWTGERTVVNLVWTGERTVVCVYLHCRNVRLIFLLSVCWFHRWSEASCLLSRISYCWLTRRWPSGPHALLMLVFTCPETSTSILSIICSYLWRWGAGVVKRYTTPRQLKTGGTDDACIFVKFSILRKC